MRIFVTGASGFIGTAVTRELIAAGHTVLGLARSDAGAAAISDLGASVQDGALDDLDILKRCATACDGVIHCAFGHDFSRFAANAEQDRRALEEMAAAMEGTDKPLVSTSGLLGLSPGVLATESCPAPAAWPRRSEDVLAAAARGVRAMTVRLSPNTHDGVNGGFVPYIMRAAQTNGVSAYIGDGANRWPAIHRSDAARLFRFAVEKGRAGARYHAVGEQGIAFRAIADAVGRRLDLPVASISQDEAARHFGFLAMFASSDAPTSSEWTGAQLGWTPVSPGLIEDIAAAP